MNRKMEPNFWFFFLFSTFWCILLAMNISLFNIFKIKNVAVRELVESLISSAIMVGLILLVYFVNIPNPNLVLFTGMIVVTAIFGLIPGIIATLGINIYSFYFFSTNHDFITFTDINSQKIIVTIITSILCYAFVGLLNHLYRRDAQRIIETNQNLKKDNAELTEISQIDVLTHTKNRFALRKDFNSYVGGEIQLMIFDIDDFKQINDKYGHSIGDRILSDVGKAAQQVFSNGSVYRFGGDEFIIIKKDLSLNEFKEKIESLQRLASKIEVNENDKGIKLSFGYTYGVVSHVMDIRSMMKFADELLYEVKRSGKNNSLGKRYDLDMVDETK